MNHQKGKYRIGIVGAGNISKLHLNALARHPEQMKSVAICDPLLQNRRDRAAEFGIGQTFADVEEMISTAEFDAAIICTPTHIRKAVILPLIEAGIPVFCEKPFAETFAEAKAIEQAARIAGVPMAINQNHRRFFTFVVARNLLKKSALGKPLHLTQVASGLRRDVGWRLDRKRYVMAVMSIHWFDGYRLLFDQEPASIYCRGINSPATEGGEDTAVSVILQFPDGAVASLTESFSAYAPNRVCTLDCQHGGLDLSYKEVIEIHADGAKIRHENPFDIIDATYFLLDDLMTALAVGREPETSAADNLKSMQIMEAAYRSLTENRVVNLEEVN